MQPNNPTEQQLSWEKLINQLYERYQRQQEINQKRWETHKKNNPVTLEQLEVWLDKQPKRECPAEEIEEANKIREAAENMKLCVSIKEEQERQATKLLRLEYRFLDLILEYGKKSLFSGIFYHSGTLYQYIQLVRAGLSPLDMTEKYDMGNEIGPDVKAVNEELAKVLGESMLQFALTMGHLPEELQDSVVEILRGKLEARKQSVEDILDKNLPIEVKCKMKKVLWLYHRQKGYSKARRQVSDFQDATFKKPRSLRSLTFLKVA